jgi:5-methylcytosine-specific restriction protein A
MPWRACLGCGVLTRQGSRCATCRPRNGSTRQWRTIRARILRRDGHACQLRLPGCTVTATHVDHIVPVINGGTDNPVNLRAACAACNLARGAR